MGLEPTSVRLCVGASTLSNIMALTPLFGNGAGAHGIGKISGVLTKIVKLTSSLCMKFPLLD